MPVVVRVLAFLMVSLLVFGFWMLALALVLGSPGRALTDPLARASLAAFLWQVLASGLLVRPLLRRSATAWAATTGLLACAAASSASLLLLSLSHGGEWGLSALRLVVESALAAALFRARGWFQVPGSGWETLWRRGWWAILATSALSAVYLSTLMARFAG